ncbi:MAG: HNH endonuclease [Alphaproteobacteria bacterium]|nr:HNH endonuclease [Alphaproteobacteria bacterium]
MTVNSLYTCDNLFLLNGMNSESVDLIYLDPPFNSKRTYAAPVGSKLAGASFKDMWGWDDVNIAYLERLYESHPDIVNFIDTIYSLHSKAMGAYITYMTQRLFEMKRVLKPTGSIYLHIDPTASHYLKIIMDGIFGKNNFRNEIIWHYQNRFSRLGNFFSFMNDTLLFYSKSNDYNFTNLPANPSERTLKSYERGWDNPSDALLVYDENKAKQKIEEYQKKNKTIKYVSPKQVNMGNVWLDINIINSQAKERTGYPTQKPLALLHRIIKASSKEGDMVFDPFCGCATACVASQQLNRKWIGCDIEEKAADILVERLSDDAGMFSDFIHTTIPPQRTDVERSAPTTPIKERLYHQQDGVCHGCFSEFDQRNLEIDHIIPKSKGGGDYYENYQLLCGACNRTKGNRPMDYLLAKVAKIRNAKQAVSYE